MFRLCDKTFAGPAAVTGDGDAVLWMQALTSKSTGLKKHSYQKALVPKSTGPKSTGLKKHWPKKALA